MEQPLTLVGVEHPFVLTGLLPKTGFTLLQLSQEVSLSVVGRLLTVLAQLGLSFSLWVVLLGGANENRPAFTQSSCAHADCEHARKYALIFCGVESPRAVLSLGEASKSKRHGTNF